MTSPELHIEQRHESAERSYSESCAPFVAPVEVTVVTVASSAVAEVPNRASLPSILPPGCATEAPYSMPNRPNRGLPRCSSYMFKAIRGNSRSAIAASSAHPWRVSPTM